MSHAYFIGVIEKRMVILSLGAQFKYVIPSFKVLAIETNRKGSIDAFIRDDDESLSRCYPSYINVILSRYRSFTILLVWF